jgi:hypothetical protein
MRSVRKITIGQAVKQGDVTLEIWCVGPGKGAPYGGGPNACGHHSAMPITRAIELFGEATSLSDLRVRCTTCGSREVDARTNPLDRSARVGSRNGQDRARWQSETGFSSFGLGRVRSVSVSKSVICREHAH